MCVAISTRWNLFMNILDLINHWKFQPRVPDKSITFVHLPMFWMFYKSVTIHLLLPFTSRIDITNVCWKSIGSSSSVKENGTIPVDDDIFAWVHVILTVGEILSVGNVSNPNESKTFLVENLFNLGQRVFFLVFLVLFCNVTRSKYTRAALYV